ncbi:MAG: PorP/SprF family type IX secretion system membrane protein [Saprospiraceae bacterium]
MKNIISTLIIIFVFASSTNAQQSIKLPHNFDNQFLRNPAATGLWNSLEVSGFYTKAFSNVDNAPTTLMGAVQYPISKQSGSFGVSIISEKASLLSNTSITGTYAYKLRGLFGNSDFLSLGMGTNLTYLGFNGTEAIVSDVDEPNLGGVESGFGINFQAGIFYSSSDNVGLRNSDDLIIQAGVGTSRINRAINIKSVYSYNEVMLINGYLGMIFSQDASLVINSYLESVYESSGQLNLTIGGRSTFSEAFIIGASFDSQLAMGIELGYKLKAFSDGLSSVIININVPFNDVSEYINPGVGISYHHKFDIVGW